jgi:type III secretory pathway component EscV
MKDRIEVGLGVSVPGIRARGSGISDDACVVMVDEVPRRRANVPTTAEHIVRPWNGGVPPAEARVTTLHPLSGAHGLWLIETRWAPSGAGDTDHEESELLTSAQVLIHHLETVLRQSLACYLGPDEVAALVGKWDEALEGLATATVPDYPARLRLTWALQDLVREQVPITNSELLLRTVGEAPPAATPIEIHRILRSALRAQLPGPREGDLLVTLPPELEEVSPGSGDSDRSDYILRLHAWLRGIAAERGPAFSIVTSVHEARETVSTAATGMYPLVTTFCEPELAL